MAIPFGAFKVIPGLVPSIHFASTLSVSALTREMYPLWSTASGAPLILLMK